MEENKRYFRVRPSIESSVTGVSDGVTNQVEIRLKKQQYSFANVEEKDYLMEYCRGLWEGKMFIGIQDFPIIDVSKLGQIVYYKTKKRVKETDFISNMTDNSFGMLDFIVSEKTKKVLEQFKLPLHSEIQVSIPEFSTTKNYYLLAFPCIPLEQIDYTKSIIIDSFSRERLKFNSFVEYKNRKQKFTEISHISLAEKYDFDILKVRAVGLFFSERLINYLKEAKMTGLDYLEQTLEL